MSRLETPLAIATISAFVFVVLLPLTFDSGRDSFPLSPYRMFARKRNHALTLDYVVATPHKEIGSRERMYLSPKFFGSSEVLQAQARIASAIRKGKKTQKNLCEDAALRLAESSTTHRYVHLIRGSHDSIKFLGEDTWGKEKKLYTCAIPRAQ